MVTKTPKKIAKSASSLYVLIDIANVTFANTKNGVPLFENYLVIKHKIENEFPGCSIVAIADARLQYVIDDANALEALDELYTAPAGERADDYIIAFAQNNPSSLIISNDRFREYPLANSFRDRIIRYMIVEEQAILSPRTTNSLVLVKNEVA